MITREMAPEAGVALLRRLADTMASMRTQLGEITELRVHRDVFARLPIYTQRARMIAGTRITVWDERGYRW